MDNSDELKFIWRKVNTDVLPTSAEMKETILNFRDQKIRNKWIVIVSSLLVSGLMIAVLIIVPFKLFTTYIGGTLIALAGFVLATTNIKSLKRFHQLNDCNNQEFLNFLRQTQRNQLYYYKNTQTVIIILNGIGLLFYFYELIASHIKWFLVLFILTAVYVAIMWFVVRPRAYKRGAKKLNATIFKIETITKQFQ